MAKPEITFSKVTTVDAAKIGENPEPLPPPAPVETIETALLEVIQSFHTHGCRGGVSWEKCKNKECMLAQKYLIGKK
jgi:hypothetical protein